MLHVKKIDNHIILALYMHSNNKLTYTNKTMNEPTDNIEYRINIIELEIKKSFDDDIKELIQELVKLKI